MKLNINLKNAQYPVYLERGILSKISQYVNLQRKIMIITDTNVPKNYATTLQSQCKESYIYRIQASEHSKCLSVFEDICRTLLKYHFSRNDCIIALGGGVVGDLSGFVASSYMRGIDFIQVPTTTLSQIDSSIGGKVAINLDDTKNIIGAFYQPKAVFIDFDTLKTLPRRHYYNGLVEALKAGLIYDKKLFDIFENTNIDDHLEEIIYRSLCVKKDVVEKDEKEMGLRKILNFGHTIGHAIESYFDLTTYYHGECVALGMLYFIDEDIKKQLLPIYEKMHLSQNVSYNKEKVFQYIKNDKKASGNLITTVQVKQIGKAILVPMDLQQIYQILKG